MIPLPPGFQINAALLGAGLLIGSVASWYLTAEYKDASWQASVNAINIEAERTLRKSLEAAHEIEMAQQKRISNLEAAYADDVDELEKVRNDNRALSIRLGGMRDPGRRPSCDGTVREKADASTVREGGYSEGRLSEEAERFLSDLTFDADRAAVYALKCKALVEGLGNTEAE